MTSQKKRPPVLTHVGGLGCFGTPEITLRANARKVYLATLCGANPLQGNTYEKSIFETH